MAIATETIIIQVFTCTRCKYRWAPKFEFNHFKKAKSNGKVIPPVACPYCHSPYYNLKRRNGA